MDGTSGLQTLYDAAFKYDSVRKRIRTRTRSRSPELDDTGDKGDAACEDAKVQAPPRQSAREFSAPECSSHLLELSRPNHETAELEHSSFEAIPSCYGRQGPITQRKNGLCGKVGLESAWGTRANTHDNLYVPIKFVLIVDFSRPPGR